MTDAELEDLELRFAATLTTGGGLREFARAVEAAERERLRQLVEAVRAANGDANAGMDTVRLPTAAQEAAWQKLLDALTAPQGTV